MPKILGIETHYLGTDGKERLSAVDWWRVKNPLSHLAQDDDFEVDFATKIVKPGEDESIAWNRVGQNYDIIFTSYIDTPKAYAWMRAAAEKYGAEIVMDIDDNIFSIDDMNPAYLRYHPGSEHLDRATTILNDVDLLITSTKPLAVSASQYRVNKPIAIMENLIDPNVYRYIPSKVPDNGDRIVIGYQGSSTHYTDLMRTGVMYAMQRLIYEYDNVDFYIIGCAIDEIRKIIPEDRLIVGEGHRDHRMWRKIWQELPIDIGIAPLVDTQFNASKSSIKYYEYALRKIPGVYSFVEPYFRVKENKTGFLARDEEEWYEKLSWLIENEILRKKMGDTARKDVIENYNINNQWKAWKELLSPFC